MVPEASSVKPSGSMTIGVVSPPTPGDSTPPVITQNGGSIEPILELIFSKSDDNFLSPVQALRVLE